mgnify:CR=1 FL=1
MSKDSVTNPLAHLTGGLTQDFGAEPVDTGAIWRGSVDLATRAELATLRADLARVTALLDGERSVRAQEKDRAASDFAALLARADRAEARLVVDEAAIGAARTARCSEHGPLFDKFGRPACDNAIRAALTAALEVKRG